MKKQLFLFFILFLLISCSDTQQQNKDSKKIDHRKPMSWGHRQTVYVFADDAIWNLAGKEIEKNLGRYFFTTENEVFFEVKRAPLNSIDQFFKFNNLLFLANLKADSEVADYVKNVMNQEVMNEVQQENAGIYPSENLWANDQYVLFILADNRENLLNINELQANKIFELFKEKLYERINQQTYKQDIHPMSAFHNREWEMQLPRNYVLFKENLSDHFISYLARLRNQADRYISVFSEKLDKSEFDKKWLLTKRAEIAWEYYDEDEFSGEDIKTEFSELGKYKCLKLSGRWQNKKFAVGGSFQSFAIYDEASRTAYLIDNSVYFPEGYKLASLIELEVISRTFNIK